ncbi:hypothetical protein Fmac_001971 [Flemingia macrophylla]|uniref:WRKY domain-containing protein n=1 Tax=Flemingia macrophylla TaxID=520843 RepID=A0ABD1NJ67_9FABA
MESEKSWEQHALVNELIEGMEVARKLKEDWSLPSSADSRNSLLQRILSSYDKALLILKWNAPISNSQTMHQESSQSPLSIQTSPLREHPKEVHHQQLKQNSKKRFVLLGYFNSTSQHIQKSTLYTCFFFFFRKMVPKWTRHVRVNIDNGFEGPLHDGYSWRKYGQKDILSAKYPRSYYRCTFRKTMGCCATKQVQRSEEDPNAFDITYRGSHTCCKGPKSQDTKEKPHSNVDFHHAKPSLTVETENVTAHPLASFGCTTQDNQHSLFSSMVLENDPFSQTSLLSPNTAESSYFLSPSFLVSDGVCNKPWPYSDAAGIVSADTSTTNSPIFDFNFSLHSVGIEDSKFPFDALDF